MIIMFQKSRYVKKKSKQNKTKQKNEHLL